jgi:hypothetical protein
MLEGLSAVPGSPDSLPTLEALLSLPNSAMTLQEEDLDLEGLFWLPPTLRRTPSVPYPL